MIQCRIHRWLLEYDDARFLDRSSWKILIYVKEKTVKRSLQDYLFLFANKVIRNDGGAFGRSVQEQIAFLNKLGDGGDLLDRSYKQYLCQRWLKKSFINLITDVVSVPLIIYYLIKSSEKTNDTCAKNVFITFGVPDTIIPDVAKRRYGDVVTVFNPGGYIDKEDRLVICNLIKKYPLSPEFILKCLLKIRMYKWVIKQYSPHNIFVYGEYSYTSSFLTDYCHRYGIKHICVMHGEKLYYIRDSYFRFDKFYIWDSFYFNLFSKLKASCDQFEIAIPPALQLKGDYAKTTDYTYYLGLENDDVIDNIINTLKSMMNKGAIIRVRPHPRYTPVNTIEKIRNNGIMLEDFREIDIEKSILTTKNVIALSSTVLNQALYNGVGAIIDDVNDASKYEKLDLLMYRFIHDARVNRLSDFI